LDNWLFQAKHLSYSHGTNHFLAKNLSFELGPGQLLHITGPNGIGKSTLLNVLLEKHPPAAGSVQWSIPKSKIAFMPQLENTEFLLPLTIRDVLEIASHEVLDVERIVSMGLINESQLGLSWNTASGGERKRTLLTRALLQDPQLLLLDEPFNHLDRASRKQMKERLGKFLGETKNAGIVMVSHETLDKSQLGEHHMTDLDLGRYGSDE